MKKRKLKIKHVLIMVVVCYFGYTLINQQLIIERYKKDIQGLTSEQKKIEESNQYIKDQIEFAQTEEYKERLARERIGLIKPGETIYVIKEE